jgi:hypothetical protein
MFDFMFDFMFYFMFDFMAIEETTGIEKQIKAQAIRVN